MIFWALGIENRARLTHFWPKKLPFLTNIYIYVDNVDEIFHPHPHIPHMRIICKNRKFRIRMANPSRNRAARAPKRKKGYMYDVQNYQLMFDSRLNEHHSRLLGFLLRKPFEMSA